MPRIFTVIALLLYCNSMIKSDTPSSQSGLYGRYFYEVTADPHNYSPKQYVKRQLDSFYLPMMCDNSLMVRGIHFLA